MKKTILLALAMTACSDTTECPAVAYPRAFSLVLQDADWAPDEYRISVRYDEGGAHSYQCDVRVPHVVYDGAIDGGVVMVGTSDAGVDDIYRSPRVEVPCTVLAAPGSSEIGAVAVQVGRGLSISFPGSPETIQLRIDRKAGLVMDGPIQPTYDETYPHGRECGSSVTGMLRVDLP